MKSQDAFNWAWVAVLVLGALWLLLELIKRFG